MARLAPSKSTGVAKWGLGPAFCWRITPKLLLILPQKLHEEAKLHSFTYKEFFDIFELFIIDWEGNYFL